MSEVETARSYLQRAFRFTELAGLARLPNLESIVLNENSGLQDRHIELLAQISTLKEIHLALCGGISDAGVAHLGKLNLCKLDVSRCEKLTGAGFASFATDSLESLDIHNCSITDEGLLNLSRFGNLKSFSLEGNRAIQGPGLNVLSCLKNLEMVRLSHLPVTNEHLDMLSGSEKLRDVRLSGCGKISGAGLAGLANAKTLENLNLKVAAAWIRKKTLNRLPG